MKNNAFNQTSPLIFYGWDPMRVKEPPPPPVHFNVGISQSPVIFNRDTGKEIMRGVDQTNTCLLAMIVVLLQNTFCLGSSSLQGSYLNLSKELKTCEKTYARIQHTPRLNVLHSLLRFHRIWFMKSRNEIPARELLYYFHL